MNNPGTQDPDVLEENQDRLPAQDASPARSPATPRGSDGGPRLSPAPALSSPRPELVCPRCRAGNAAPADFCSRCGYSFLETRAFDLQPSAPTGGLVGQVINGKYRVHSILGEGGFGVVYKVELLLFDTGNLFALKLLHPSLSQDRSFRRRFLREAGLAMALIHENTIQIREFGQTEDGQLFFTMDYCTGDPLKSVIAREGFLNVNRALHVTRQILSVMKLAHARGIIHRDIKPENIFLEKDGASRDFVKVGDFGLAKSFGGGDEARRGQAGFQASDITRGGIVGTPRYMSPEQAMGRDDLDDRSDLYSIGVVLHEMLYAQVPAERLASDPSNAALSTPPSHPGHLIPHPVWEVVRKALEVPRESRYQSAGEFLGAIDALPQYRSAYLEAGEPRKSGGSWKAAAVLILLAGVLGLAAVESQYGFLQLLLKNREGTRPVAFPAVVTPSSQSTLPGSARDTVAGPEGAGRVAPFPREGIRAYMSYKKGDVLRYQTFRKGMADRELIFEVIEEPEPGVYKVKVSPGERTFSWLVDSKTNLFQQEFQLPNPETGALTETVKRTRLQLPPADAIVDGEYVAGELRVRGAPVDLLLPQDPKLRFEMFARCLRVESRDESRVHYHYYQEGKGLVGIEVFDPEEMRTTPGHGPPVYARYLIERTTTAKGKGD